MHLLDWLVLGVYIAAIVAIGAWANRRQTDTEAYFVGNRGVKWWAAGLSIIATSFSAASILGVPGLAYSADLWYLQYSLGDVLAAVVVAVLFIPFFHRVKGLTTAYEYLERRFDLKSRLLGSTLFVLTVILRAGTLLYGAALLFSTLVPTDLVPGLTSVEEAVVVFGVIAITYTVLGGISAVIWTDVIQFVVMSLGVLASIYVAAQGAAGGLGEAWALASEAGKLDVVHLEAPLGGQGLVTAIFGYGLLALSLFGTNQQPVQRYMTVKDVASAQRALVLGVSAGGLGVLLSLLLGAFLYVFYAAYPELLPAGFADLPAGQRADALVPHFIDTQVPPLLTGALVAAVFAAAMSSLDSALNSLSAALTVDFLARFRPATGEQARLRFAKVVVVTAGIGGIAIGVYASRLGDSLIALILAFMGYFAGGLLGLFLLGMLTRRATGTGAFTGAIVGTLVVLMVTENSFGLPRLNALLGIAPVPFIWSTAIGVAVTALVGYGVSLLGPAPGPAQLAGLTLRHRNDVATEA